MRSLLKPLTLHIHKKVCSPHRESVQQVQYWTYLYLNRLSHQRPLLFSWSRNCPYCLVLVGSRNGFVRDFTINLNKIEGLMEDWLKCQISPLIKYRQNQYKQSPSYMQVQIKIAGCKFKLRLLVASSSVCLMCSYHTYRRSCSQTRTKGRKDLYRTR